jgi:hypothetical protein
MAPVKVRPAHVVFDPGLLTSVHFARVPKTANGPRIGLGLTHPLALKYHTDENSTSTRAQDAWYVELARACLARGWKLAVFTNGSPEDEAYLGHLRPKLSAVGEAASIDFLPRFGDPAALAAFVSGLDLVMAHRLHANIAAYSYLIPQIGFTWDVKLKSFLAQVGRSDCVCRVGIDTIETVVELATRKLAEGVDRVRHRAVIAQAQKDVATLGEALLDAVRGSVGAAHAEGLISNGPP